MKSLFCFIVFFGFLDAAKCELPDSSKKGAVNAEYQYKGEILWKYRAHHPNTYRIQGTYKIFNYSTGKREEPLDTGVIKYGSGGGLTILGTFKSKAFKDKESLPDAIEVTCDIFVTEEGKKGELHTKSKIFKRLKVKEDGFVYLRQVKARY